jgi:hypothetical protein
MTIPSIGLEERKISSTERARADHKKGIGRMFPTWSEALEVLRYQGSAKRSSNGTSVDSPTIRVNLGDGRAAEIKEILADHGGTFSSSAMMAFFEFDSLAKRDVALDAIRSLFGWTSVDPGE